MNANMARDFLEGLSDKAFEWEKTREAPSIASKIFMDNESKLPNDSVAVENTML